MLCLFPFSLGKGKADLFATELVFLIYIFNKCLEVGEGFSRFVRCGSNLFTLSHRYLL